MSPERSRSPLRDTRLVTLDEVAEQWGVDARTVGRKLARSGATPRDYVDQDVVVVAPLATPPIDGVGTTEARARYQVGTVIRLVPDHAIDTPAADARYGDAA